MPAAALLDQRRVGLHRFGGENGLVTRQRLDGCARYTLAARGRRRRSRHKPGAPRFLRRELRAAGRPL